MKYLTKFTSLILVFAVMLSFASPVAYAKDAPTTVSAQVTENGDLIINNGEVEIRVVITESDDQIVTSEYHNGTLFQTVTTNKHTQDEMITETFSVDENGNSQSTVSIEKIPHAIYTSEQLPASVTRSKSFVGTLMGRALHLNDADKDFDFSVRVWNEVVDSGTTSYKLPNTAKTAAQWTNILASGSGLALGAKAATAALSKFISVGTLIYSTATLLIPALQDTTVSSSYSKNLVTMTPAANDPVYSGRTVTANGTTYFIHDDLHPQANGEIFREGIGGAGSSLASDIFDYLYNMYDPSGLRWDRS